MARFFSLSGDRYHVDCTQLAAVLGIGLRFKRDLLPLFQRSETLRLDGREVHEHIVSPLIVGNKAIPFSVVEPLNSSVHLYYLLSARSVNVRTDASRVMLIHAEIYYTPARRACQDPF